MNNEVTRLRQLRRTTLKTRALASALNPGNHTSGVYERACVLSWRIARIATGTLRSHPYHPYQRDQGLLERGADGLQSYLKASLANFRGRGMRVFFDELTTVLRQLDDARSLTLSTDLSDALGRAQVNLRMLVDEVRLQICRISGEDAENIDNRAEPRLAAPHSTAPSYLAL
jgi:hypothetical protein